MYLYRHPNYGYFLRVLILLKFKSDSISFFICIFNIVNRSFFDLFQSVSPFVSVFTSILIYPLFVIIIFSFSNFNWNLEYLPFHLMSCLFCLHISIYSKPTKIDKKKNDYEDGSMYTCCVFVCLVPLVFVEWGTRCQKIKI